MELKKGFIPFLITPRKWCISLSFIFTVSITGLGLSQTGASH